jgi:hypothetical protein
MADRSLTRLLIGERATPRRRAALIALVIGVIAVHGCVTQGVFDSVAEFGRSDAMPPRMEVTYVREMEPSAPPVAAPAAPPAPVERVAAASAPKKKPKPKPPKAASAPEPTPEPPAPVVAEAGAAVASAASASDLTLAAQSGASAPSAPASEAVAVADAASAPVVAAAASAPASGASAFEWPVSTRVSYIVNGYYRGDMNGSAQFEWIRQGTRYQIHLEAIIGNEVLTVGYRRMFSEGDVTERGLVPQRYDQEAKLGFQTPRRATLRFEPDGVVLANGNRGELIPGVQDTVSQFVQLTYVFSTRPELLTIGGTIDFPLALPHRVGVWTYDVVDHETLDTPFGPLDTVRLKPRRRSASGNEILIEMWFAPALRYFPVRLRLTQANDDASYLEMVIKQRPEMAAGS